MSQFHLPPILLRCARELGLSAAEIAHHVGVDIPSAVTRAIERGRGKLSQGGQN